MTLRNLLWMTAGAMVNKGDASGYLLFALLCWTED